MKHTHTACPILHLYLTLLYENNSQIIYYGILSLAWICSSFISFGSFLVKNIQVRVIKLCFLINYSSSVFTFTFTQCAFGSKEKIFIIYLVRGPLARVAKYRRNKKSRYLSGAVVRFVVKTWLKLELAIFC